MKSCGLWNVSRCKSYKPLLIKIDSVKVIVEAVTPKVALFQNLILNLNGLFCLNSCESVVIVSDFDTQVFLRRLSQLMFVADTFQNRLFVHKWNIDADRNLIFLRGRGERAVFLIA